jgi:hypothetical protein
MKSTLPRILIPAVLLATLLASSLASAQTTIITEEQSADVDDAAPVPRVARLSFVDGDVSFLRAGVTDWAPAVENLPLLAGDQLYTGRGARVELQLARGNYIRLSESTELTIADLSDSYAQFEITEGTAIIRIERLDTVFHRFEVDTPSSAVLIQQDGLYRVQVRGEKESELIVRSGEAEVSTDEGSFRVREGHTFHIDATTGKFELAVDAMRDDWDQWSYDRDTAISRSSTDLAPDYVTSYETGYNDFYGVSDLSSYGTWTNYSSYGQCWIPRVGSDWAPYRSGQWLWIPAAGWTWLSNERWGWAPYHYGRWSYLSGLGWAWIPGFGSAYRGYGYRDYHWRPALVYFFNSPTPRGNYVGWYPLAPGERWRRHRGDDRAHFSPPRDARRGTNDDRFKVQPPQLHHGVTILPVEGFTRGSRSGVRPMAPGAELLDFINKGARSGLPEMKALPVAAAPELAENDRRRSRRVAIPANEIIERPVVTRNPKDDSSVGLGAARERRIISPRKPDAASQGLVPGERRSERGSERRAKPATPFTGSQPANDPGVGPSPEIRRQLPADSENVEGNGTARERKRNREGDSTSEAPVLIPERNINPAKEERRRARQAQPPTKESGPAANGQADNGTRSGDRRPTLNDPKPREDSQSRKRATEPAKPQDNGQAAPGVESRQERPKNADNPARQERHQEKVQRQERQQQQQEQRRKP